HQGAREYARRKLPAGCVDFDGSVLGAIMSREDTARQIATILLESGCVRFNFDTPFRWASGIESPIYCDCRGLVSRPDNRRAIVDAMVAVLDENALLPSRPALIAGVATAGIPWATMLADRTNLPLAYVRPSAKSH